MLYASAATTIAKLADVAAGSYLRSGGVGTAPVWSTLVLPNAATTGDLHYASASNTISNLADVAVGSVLTSGGVGVAPSWSTGTGLFIQNQTTLQASSNFNISGNGYIGGNVGIATVSPLTKLDVNGNLLVRGTNTNTPATPASAVELLGGRTNAGGLVGGQTTADIALQYGGGGYRHFIQTRHNSTITAGGNDIDFYINNSATSTASTAPGTNNIQVMTLENYNGGARIGLGVTAPLINLDAALNNTIGTSATSVTQHDVSNRGTKVSFGAVCSNTLTEFVGMRALVAAGTNGCGNTGDVTFNTWECNTAASREVARINGSGNMGIGTASPAATLHVNGTSKFGSPGTVIKAMQVGQMTLGTCASGSCKWTLTFPNAFANTPKVIANVQTQIGQTYSDNFSVTVQSVSTTSVVFVVQRTDSNVAWGQTPLINWFAFDN